MSAEIRQISTPADFAVVFDVSRETLDRLAIYMEKTEGIKSKIKSALMYPIAVVVVAFFMVIIS